MFSEACDTENITCTYLFTNVPPPSPLYMFWPTGEHQVWDIDYFSVEYRKEDKTALVRKNGVVVETSLPVVERRIGVMMNSSETLGKSPENKIFLSDIIYTNICWYQKSHLSGSIIRFLFSMTFISVITFDGTSFPFTCIMFKKSYVFFSYGVCVGEAFPLSKEHAFPYSIDTQLLRTDVIQAEKQYCK